jgi:hypothetical protein
MAETAPIGAKSHIVATYSSFSPHHTIPAISMAIKSGNTCRTNGFVTEAFPNMTARPCLTFAKYGVNGSMRGTIFRNKGLA